MSMRPSHFIVFEKEVRDGNDDHGLYCHGTLFASVIYRVDDDGVSDVGGMNGFPEAEHTLQV